MHNIYQETTNKVVWTSGFHSTYKNETWSATDKHIQPKISEYKARGTLTKCWIDKQRALNKHGYI